MKKNLAVMLSFFVILTTGCTKTKVNNVQNNVKVSKNATVNSIAEKLAYASLTNNEQKMNELGNALMKNNATPQKIEIVGTCHIVNYSYQGKIYNAQACNNNSNHISSNYSSSVDNSTNITNSSSSNHQIDQFAKEVAKASLNKDDDKMKQYLTMMYKQNTKVQRIILKGDCHVVEYTVNEQQYTATACR